MPTPQQIQQAFARAQGYVLSGHIPVVAVALADRSRIIDRCAFGEGGQEDLALLDRVWALASITKAICSVGVARLHERGVLDYDTPIAEIVPQFGTDAQRRRIALSHIFTHSTGLPAQFAIDSSEIHYSQEALFRSLCEGDLLFEPGTRMSYATYTYQLINAAVARLPGGMSMSEFIAEEVFAPAGMTDTAFSPSPAKAIRALDHPIPDNGMLPEYCAMEMSGSGLWSSMADLVALGQALLTEGKLMSPDTFNRVTAAQPGLPMLGNETTLSSRTLGWVKESQGQFPKQPDSGFYHGGATGTLLWIDPAAELVFVLLTNRWGSGNDHAFDVLNCLYE